MAEKHALERRGAYRFFCHLLLIAGSVLANYDRNLIGVIAEPLKADLHLSDTQIGLLQGAAFALCYATAAFPLAWALDKAPRVRILGICMLVLSGGTALCGTALGFPRLFAGRSITAIAESWYGPGAMSLISDLFAPPKVPRATAMFLLAPSLGLGLAMIGGGALRHFFETRPMSVPMLGPLHPWQQLVLISGLLGSVLAVLMMAVVREPARHRMPLSSSTAGQRVQPRPDIVLARFLPFLALYIAGCTLILMVMFSMAAWAPAFFGRAFLLTASQASRMIGPSVLLGGLAGPLVATLLLGRKVGTDAVRRMIWIAACVGLLAAACVIMTGMSKAPRQALAGLGATILMSSTIAPMIVGPIQILVPNQVRARFHALAAFFFTVIAGGVGPTLVGVVTDHVLRDATKVGHALAMVGGASSITGVVLLAISLKKLGKFEARHRLM